MNPSFETKWQIWLSHVLVVSWLFYLAITIWQHATHSVQTHKWLLTALPRQIPG